MKSMTVYIAGPMRGKELYNFPAFFEAEERLVEHGFTTINPAARDKAQGFDETRSFEENNFDLAEALGWDLHQIAQHCSHIALLPDWWDSSGAKAEVALGLALGLRFIFVGSDRLYDYYPSIHGKARWANAAPHVGYQGYEDGRP